MHQTITSRKNDKIVHMKKLGSDRLYREEKKEFLCDGDKLLFEAAAAGMNIKTVLAAGEIPSGLSESAEVYLVPQSIIDYVSTQKSPQRVIFSCEMPKGRPCESDLSGSIIIENIQDPGNVGTILRSAAAFCVPAVIMVGACADPYNPKTVRSSMGAVFRQPIIKMDMGSILKLKKSGFRIIGAALSEKSTEIGKTNLENALVAVGSEGCGLSGEILSLCDSLMIIPMSPDCESLNAGVAASIIMWEIMKKR